MSHSDRKFEDSPAVRERVPLLLGVYGASGSGKTFSALRLATGIQRVTGGDIFVIDTEAKRALHYADIFKFRHVPFNPPFGPLDYLAAIQHCIAKGARVLVIDSMTHEHSGEGGVMDQVDKYLDAKCGDDIKAREKNFMRAMVKPKGQRRTLTSRIVQLGINGVFCYRAHEKIKPVSGKEPENLGWVPETTSPLIYEMAQTFLLDPGSDGVPTFSTDKRAEGMLIKSPQQFRGWFKDGQRLDEDMGERMARWSAGGPGATAAEAAAAAQPRIATGRAPAQSSGKTAHLQKLADLRRRLDWTTEKAAAWRAEVFGEGDAAKLSIQQLDDAISLMTIWADQGAEAYEGERSTLAGLGRVKDADIAA